MALDERRSRRSAAPRHSGDRQGARVLYARVL